MTVPASNRPAGARGGRALLTLLGILISWKEVKNHGFNKYRAWTSSNSYCTANYRRKDKLSRINGVGVFITLTLYSQDSRRLYVTRHAVRGFQNYGFEIVRWTNHVVLCRDKPKTNLTSLCRRRPMVDTAKRLHYHEIKPFILQDDWESGQAHAHTDNHCNPVGV